MQSIKSSHYWLAFNFVGLAVWLWFASSGWPDPGLEHCFPDSGENISFVFVVLPATAIAALVYVLAGILVGTCLVKRTNRSLRIALVFTTITWLVAGAYDYNKTVRVISDACPIEELRSAPG
jgi:hypothetical protein